MRISKTYFLASTLLAGVTVAAPAFAQATDPAPAPSQDPNVQAAPTDQTPATTENPADTAAQDRQDVEPAAAETIVVTGSRIVSPNIVSLAPVQVVGEQEIDQAGAINIQEVLLENPAFGTPALSTTNSAFLTSGAGAATVDLRDLGPAGAGSNRTLVLINSRRVVGGFGGSPIVDLNVIPTQFVERVDILTGGASSLYGADAVAGVVNFIYKRNFEGLLAEGQYGLTQRGDSQRYQMSATAGANFAEDRGNIMVHVGYTNDKGLLSRERKNTRVDEFDGFYFYYDPDLYGTPVTPYYSSYMQQGRFTVGDVNPNFPGNQTLNFTYGPTGVLQPCATTNGGTCNSRIRDRTDLDDDGDTTEIIFPSIGTGTGPNGFNRQFFRTLSTPVKRWLFAERGHFDITDDISFITEATYAKTTAKSEIEPFPLDSANAFANGLAPIETMVNGVPVLNPLVPALIAQYATDQDGDGLKDMAFRKRLTGVGTRNLTADRDFLRLVAGFEGHVFERFNWDVTYNFGRTEEQQISNGQVNVQSLRNALQGIPDVNDLDGDGITNEVVCADAQARNEGCVPIDLFGANSITPAMAAYVAAEGNHSFKVTQQVWAANLSGPIVDLPAGPLGIAVGAEYRKEQSEENWDALTNAGLNAGNALPDTRGEFDVKEVYGEVNVPILKDMAFAHQLNLRAAGRLSDYSTIGNTTTWSLGADYAPIEDVRFRATLAKAVRAPNIGELFTGPAQTFPVGLVDPCLIPGGLTLTTPGAVADRCRADPGVLQNIQQNGQFTLTQPDKQGISGFNIGNPNLGPETGKSFTAGVVINPRSYEPLRNLVLSVDYWQIKVDDAIIAPPRQTILNQCYQFGDPNFCQFITRFPTQTGGASPGAIQFINSVGVNASTIKSSGLDTVVQYRMGLSSLLDGLNANARLSWSHYFKGYAIPVEGAPKNPYVGEIGTPKNKWNGTIGFNTSKWGASFTGTYIGESCEDDVFLAAIPPGFDPCTIKIDPEFYLDTQINFRPMRNYEFFFGVDNLLDNDAPNILSGSPFNVTGSDTAASTYDVFGRRFYAGARLRF